VTRDASAPGEVNGGEASGAADGGGPISTPEALNGFEPDPVAVTETLADLLLARWVMPVPDSGTEMAHQGSGCVPGRHAQVGPLKLWV
jgi:hypothetical protein